MSHRRTFALGVAGTILFALATVDSRQQVKKIDDTALKDAGAGTEWVSNGMNWAEQRYSTATQINPRECRQAVHSPGRMNSGTGGGNQAGDSALFERRPLYGHELEHRRRRRCENRQRNLALRPAGGSQQ